MKLSITVENKLLITTENSIENFALLAWAKKVRKAYKRCPDIKIFDIIDIKESIFHKIEQ